MLPLITLELTNDATGESGRVFTRSQTFFSELEALEKRFAARFADEEDRERLAFLRAALEAPAVTVDAYRGEEAPYEIHVYLTGAAPGGHALFACVLVPPSLLDQFLSTSDAIVVETATMQVIDGVTSAAIVAGLERWCQRLWPRLKPPAFWVTPWPKSFTSDEGAIELLTLFPIRPSETLMTHTFAEADARFVPPASLVGEVGEAA